jgi:hypothetical protein
MFTSVQETVVDLFTSNMASIMAIFGMFLVIGVVFWVIRKIRKG